MQVVVAATGSGLGIESHADGLAGIGGQVHILGQVAAAGNGCQRNVGSQGPGLAIVGGDKNHELLRVVVLETGGGTSAGAGVNGEGSVEGQHGVSSRGQVNLGSDEPLVAAGTKDIHAVVTGFNAVAHGAGVGPVAVGTHRGSHTVGIENVGTGPARIAAQRGVEGLAEGQSLGNASGTAADDGDSGVASGAVGLNTEGVIRIGGQAGDGIGGVVNTRGHNGSVGHVVHRIGGVGSVKVVVMPVEGHTAGGDGGDSHVEGARASRQSLNNDIVDTAANIGVAAGAGAVVDAGELEGQAGASGSGGGQRGEIQFNNMLNGGDSIGRPHAHEGGDVIVRDIAKLEHCGGAGGAVGGAHLVVERHLQAAQRLSESGQDGITDIAASGGIAKIGATGDIGASQLDRQVKVRIVGDKGSVTGAVVLGHAAIIDAGTRGLSCVGAVAVVNPAGGKDGRSVVRIGLEAGVSIELFNIRQCNSRRAGGTE